MNAPTNSNPLTQAMFALAGDKVEIASREAVATGQTRFIGFREGVAFIAFDRQELPWGIAYLVLNSTGSVWAMR